jgi:hypothetical protein
MAGVWCDVLLVRYSVNGSTQVCSAFYPVPFSSGGLTVQRVLDIEADLNTKPYIGDTQVLGYDLLNEMLIDEDRVETIVSRQEMEVLMKPEGTEKTEVQTMSVPVAPTQERLDAIAGLFTYGFCDDRMARGIYAAALGVEKQTEQI